MQILKNKPPCYNTNYNHLLWNILGAAGIAVGFPLDTVKVRIQTQDPAKGLKYTSTFQCMRSIIKEEGVCTLLFTSAFWKW